MRNWKTLVAASIAAVGPGGDSAVAQVQRLVALVVAPSASTRLEAQRMLRGCRWADTTALRDADLVLVVVRSSGTLPLASSYDSLKWLRDAASGQLNESGAQFHVYLYMIREDLSLLQSSHQSYDAGPATALVPPINPALSPDPGASHFPCG